MSVHEYTPPRGMRDIDAEEMKIRLWVIQKILKVLERYNFELVEPSTIENLETLEAKCGPSIRDEIYWFEDKAGRRLGLRFDLTVGLARMVATRQDLILPLKLCAISNMWRYDEPQYGRYRCFYQWDAEIFGSEMPEADAEIIALSIDVLKEVGLEDFEVKISSRKLVEGFLNSVGIFEGGKVEQVLRVIDKHEKISEEEFLSELGRIGLKDEILNKVLGFVSIKGEPNKVLDEVTDFVGKNEKALNGLGELKSVIDFLKAFGKNSKCILDMGIVRGIGYYDGVVFEVYDKAEVDVGAVVAGGRYNGLCKIYGRDLPATGVAGGIERLILTLKKANLLPKIEKSGKVFVAAVNENVRGKVLEIVEKIRSWGFSADFDLRQRPLKKQLEHASKLNFSFTIIVGEKELERGAVKVKDMNRFEEFEVKLEKLKDFLTVKG
ncbi:MAG: histidine--tRNA ligase [Candidatus Bathyarchaeota archaeon]